MWNEFYRLKKSNIFYLLILLSLLSQMFFSINYFNKAVDSKTYWVTGISSYQDKDDIIKSISDIENSIGNLDPSDPNYKYSFESLSKEKEIYQFLENHFISYDKLIEFSAIQNFQDNNVAYYQNLLGFLTYVLILASIILSLFLIHTDFLYGTHKYLYTRGERRMEIILKKYLLHITIIMSLLFVLILMGYIMGTGSKITKPIFIFTQGQIAVMSVKNYIILNFISSIINIWFLSSIIFFISLFLRNIFMAFIAIICEIALTLFVIPMHFINYPYLFISMPILDWFAMNGSVYKTIIFTGFKFSLLLEIIIMSCRLFNKKELL